MVNRLYREHSQRLVRCHDLSHQESGTQRIVKSFKTMLPKEKKNFIKEMDWKFWNTIGVKEEDRDLKEKVTTNDQGGVEGLESHNLSDYRVKCLK